MVPSDEDTVEWIILKSHGFIVKYFFLGIFFGTAGLSYFWGPVLSFLLLLHWFCFWQAAAVTGIVSQKS